jgi:hypothetical protein
MRNGYDDDDVLRPKTDRPVDDTMFRSLLILDICQTYYLSKMQ